MNAFQYIQITIIQVYKERRGKNLSSQHFNNLIFIYEIIQYKSSLFVMAMYANVGGASKLLAQTSAEAGGGVTELVSSDTVKQGNYYRRYLTFPSDYTEIKISISGSHGAGRGQSSDLDFVISNYYAIQPILYWNKIDFTSGAITYGDIAFAMNNTSFSTYMSNFFDPNQYFIFKPYDLFE